MNRSLKTLALIAGAAAASCSGVDDEGLFQVAPDAIVAGAGYTTFDEAQGGCLGSPNGVDCNLYEAKPFVYVSGGPTKAGLSDGDYFFAVLTPGAQNGGFLDGAAGNLSDVFAGGTAGDLGSGDAVANRTFTVAGHDVVAYAGTHATGWSPQGHFVIGLAPFDDTDNPGGVHILAVCAVGADNPSACKYDAFRIAGGEPPLPVSTVSGAKYYDADTNGQLDPGEPLLAGWPIAYSGSASGVIPTDASGGFGLSLVGHSYHFSEVLPPAPTPWMETGNVVSQAVASGGAFVALVDKAYEVGLVDGSAVTGVYFGNVCLGPGGGHTLGFWSNKHGAALFGADDLAKLVSINLRDAAGAHFNPASYTAFRSWLLGAHAKNMAYMLSAQLAAMELNVLNGFVSAGARVHAPGVFGANANGFVTVDALMEEADVSLLVHGLTPGGSPARAYQEVLENALDAANNDKGFVQPTPETCPLAVFP